MRLQLNKKKYFVIFSLIICGLPGAIGLLWAFGSYGSTGFWLLLVALAFGAAYFWSEVMWRFFAAERERLATRVTRNP